MSNIVQSSYDNVQPKGFPGGRATTSGWDADTKINTDDAVIPFGRACSRDGDNGAVLGGTNFCGITQADQAKDGVAPPADSRDSYAIGDNMSLMTFGDIWVLPGANVGPASIVAYAPSTGIIGPLNGTYTQEIQGARFLETVTSASGAVVKVRLSQKQGKSVETT